MEFKFNNVKYKLIVLNVAGSRLYGNSTELSDYDYRGVFIANKESHLSLNNTIEQLGSNQKEGKELCKVLQDSGLNIHDTDDIILYEVKRFIQLSLDNNPNILDILCHDYTSGANIYINDLGKKLLNSKDLFMSKKLKNTFSGYAFAQLKKIKSHNKWVNEFPNTSDVIKVLKCAVLENGDVDFDFLVQNFGGKVAEYVTGQTAQEHNNIDNCLSWENFYKMYSIIGYDLNKYRLPRLYDYTKIYDLKAQQLDKDKNIKILTSSGIVTTTSTARELLLTTGGFRAIGSSIYSIFDMVDNKPLGGVYDLNGNVKTHPSKEVGDFSCIAIFDKNEYKKYTDHINNMWNWKLKRNKERSVLEDKFGYDTKHASHLIRLLLVAKDLLKTGMYTPELSGDTLQIVKDVRAGKYKYDYIVTYAEKLNNELDELYKSEDCVLSDKPDRVKVNTLLLKILNN